MTSYEIYGVTFLLDVDNRRLVEERDPDNAIYFHEMTDLGTHYQAQYSLKEKCIQSHFNKVDPGDIVTIEVPQMTRLAPDEVARVYGMPIAEVIGKSDQAVLMNSPAYKQRVEMGKQPVVVIEGHPFYVSINSGYLQPHDDFTTMGISLKEMDNYEEPDGKAWVPYDPVKHQIKEVDYSKVLTIPTDWVFVELPFANELDPYGYGRQQGCIDLMLSLYPIKMHSEARTVSWEEAEIKELIAQNKKALLGKGQQQKSDQQKQDKKKGGPKR